MSAYGWGPGRYDPASPQNSPGGAGNGVAGASCDCKKTCCVASVEAHYQILKSSGQTALDAPGGTSKTLQNRISIEFYNAGTTIFEVSNTPFVYNDGNGRPVAVGASYSLDVGPAISNGGTSHYVQFSSGTGDCRVTELGAT